MTPARETAPKVLCLVGCCKAKLRHPAPAQDLYCSALFRLCRRWAEQHTNVWAILSAYHGVVRPEEVIEPYEATIAQRRPFGGPALSPREFGGWLYAHVQAWRSRHVTPSQVPRLVVLAGKEYWRWLPEHGLNVETPLDGLGIGERLRWLKQQTAPCRSQDMPPRQPLLFPADPST